MNEKTKFYYDKYIKPHKKYTDINLVPKEDILGVNSFYRFSTDYGDIKSKISYLQKEATITVNCAIDKTHFIKELIKLSPHSDSLELLEEFKGYAKRHLFKTDMGLIKIKIADILAKNSKGIITSKCFINKNEYFLNNLKEKNPNIYNNFKLVSEFTSTKAPVILEGELGKVRFIRANDAYKCVDVIFNHYLDKTEYFIRVAKEIHGDKYCYSKVKNIKTATDYVTLICKKHGDFSKKVKYHITDHKTGCAKCAKEAVRGIFGNLKVAERKKKEYLKIKTKVYILRLLKGNENFFKVGLTRRKVTMRSNTFADYESELLMTIETNLYQAIKIENKILDTLSEYSYTPKFLFGGYTECLSVNPVEHILNINELINITK